MPAFTSVGIVTFHSLSWMVFAAGPDPDGATADGAALDAAATADALAAEAAADGAEAAGARDAGGAEVWDGLAAEPEHPAINETAASATVPIRTLDTINLLLVNL